MKVVVTLQLEHSLQKPSSGPFQGLFTQKGNANSNRQGLHHRPSPGSVAKAPEPPALSSATRVWLCEYCVRGRTYVTKCTNVFYSYSG